MKRFFLTILVVAWVAFPSHAQSTLSIERIELAFASEKLIEVVPQHSHLIAIANIQHEGFGLVSGQWEVASPPTTSANPVFVPLTFVQEMASTRQIELKSPELPTDQIGLYLVRLQLTDNVKGKPLKPLRYQVVP